MQYSIRAVLNGILLGFIALCVAGLVAKNLRRDVPPAAPAAHRRPAGEADRLLLPCDRPPPLCLNMEAYTREVLQSSFPDLPAQRADRACACCMFQQPENEHFCRDYQVVGPAIVLVRLHRDGTATWDNLIEAARLQRDKARFVEYLRRAVAKATEGGGRKGKEEEDITRRTAFHPSPVPSPQSLCSFRLPPSALRLCNACPGRSLKH